MLMVALVHKEIQVDQEVMDKWEPLVLQEVLETLGLMEVLDLQGHLVQQVCNKLFMKTSHEIHGFKQTMENMSSYRITAL